VLFGSADRYNGLSAELVRVARAITRCGEVGGKAAGVCPTLLGSPLDCKVDFSTAHCPNVEFALPLHRRLVQAWWNYQACNHTACSTASGAQKRAVCTDKRDAFFVIACSGQDASRSAWSDRGRRGRRCGCTLGRCAPRAFVARSDGRSRPA
jgi:hypothetical protein